MRTPRARLPGPCHFHCLARCVNREFLLHDEEKEHFTALMRRVETFSGVSVLTFCVMTNHVHILLTENPHPGPLSDDEFLRRVGALYQGKALREIEQKLGRFREQGSEAGAAEYKARFEARMHDVSAFMKTLLQRFTQWYNRRMERSGPLWEGRFKSVLVEGKPGALMAMAGYIDLNPLRAGMVEDPLRYRWCGYAEAVAGSRAARRGLTRLAEVCAERPEQVERECGDWTTVQAQYRRWLYVRGAAVDDPRSGRKRRGFSADEVEKVEAAGGELDWATIARCRIRHFSEGVMLGSSEFLAGPCRELGRRMGLVREREPRELPGPGLAGLSVFRAWGAG